jgi:hypothetical protein
VVKVPAGSVVELTKFRQAPYDQGVEGSFLRLSRDPSRSEVELKLTLGQLQGEVKKLNKDAGSTFEITTRKGTMRMGDSGRIDIRADSAS